MHKSSSLGKHKHIHRILRRITLCSLKSGKKSSLMEQMEGGVSRNWCCFYWNIVYDILKKCWVNNIHDIIISACLAWSFGKGLLKSPTPWKVLAPWTREQAFSVVTCILWNSFPLEATYNPCHPCISKTSEQCPISTCLQPKTTESCFIALCFLTSFYIIFYFYYNHPDIWDWTGLETQ